MPKRRRKQVVTHTTPELPFPKVRVEWIDILSDSGWATDKEFDRDDDGSITFGDRTMIPTSCVKKIQKLQ